MECYCDYEPAVFYWSKIRKARKLHRCYECGAAILPGQQYEYVAGKWDWFSEFHTCAACVDIRIWVKNNVPCLCWGHGNMIEDCREAVEEAHYRAPQETLGLRFGFLRRLAMRDKAPPQPALPSVGETK